MDERDNMKIYGGHDHLPPDLLGHHLGLLGEADQQRVDAALASSSELRAARARLQRLLAPLDADPSVEPPANLIHSILDRIEHSRNVLPFRSAPPVTAELERGAAAGGRLFSMRDLVGIAAVITLFVGLFVPGFRTARMNAQQAVCADHLRQIGSGYAAYQQTYETGLPYVSGVPAGTPWFRREPGAASHSNNSQNFFVLFRDRYVPASAANCPGHPGDQPFSGDGLENYSDFPDPRNNSFVTNLVTTPRPKSAVQPAHPLAADMTPLVDDNRQVIAGSPTSPNSSSHGLSRGQNVLRADRSVGFSRSPNIGPDSDDIYRVIGVQQYTGMEHPRSATDVFLVP